MAHGLGVTLFCHTLIIILIYKGVKFTCNGHWDAHLKDLVTSGKRKLNSLLSNPSLSLYLRRQVILSILRPSLEYGNEVWRCTSTQSKALDAVLLVLKHVMKLCGVTLVLSL